MPNKITNVIHGLSDILKIQDKIKEQAEGLAELYGEMATNFKEQNDKIEEHHSLNSKKFHKYEMRIVKLETTIETIFTVANSNKKSSEKSRLAIE